MLQRITNFICKKKPQQQQLNAEQQQKFTQQTFEIEFKKLYINKLMNWKRKDFSEKQNLRKIVSRKVLF